MAIGIKSLKKDKKSTKGMIPVVTDDRVSKNSDKFPLGGVASAETFPLGSGGADRARKKIKGRRAQIDKEVG